MGLGQAIDNVLEKERDRWTNPSWWNGLIVLPWVIGAIFCITGWWMQRQVAARQLTTTGIVTEHQPSNHNRFGYVFKVGAKSYSGWQSPKADELRIGTVVTVYYDPRDPSTNALTDFNELSVQTFGPVPLMLFGIGGVVIFVFWRRRQARIVAASN